MESLPAYQFSSPSQPTEMWEKTKEPWGISGCMAPEVPIRNMLSDFFSAFTSLVERRGEEVRLIRAGEVIPLLEDEGRYENYPIFPFEERNLFETYRIVIKPGGTLSARPHLAGAEEYITVFDGMLQLRAGEECYTLKKGDSIRFRADVPHCYENPGAEETQLSMMIHYQN